MEGQRRVVASVDRAAIRCGLDCGMTVTHAQSVVPDLAVAFSARRSAPVKEHRQCRRAGPRADYRHQ
jgi:hypothetical protein